MKILLIFRCRGRDSVVFQSDYLILLLTTFYYCWTGKYKYPTRYTGFNQNCNNTHFTEAPPGFNVDLLKQIVTELNLENDPNFEGNVCLLLDEMKVKSGIVFNSSGRLNGFCDLGEINNELKTFEDALKGEKMKGVWQGPVLLLSTMHVVSIPAAKTHQLDRSFIHTASKVWNSLSQTMLLETISHIGLKSFKRCVHRIILENGNSLVFHLSLLIIMISLSCSEPSVWPSGSFVV